MSLLLLFRPSEGVAEEVELGDQYDTDVHNVRSRDLVRLLSVDAVTFRSTEKVRL